MQKVKEKKCSKYRSCLSVPDQRVEPTWEEFRAGRDPLWSGFSKEKTESLIIFHSSDS